MTKNVILELLLPFLGTSLGAGCVFFLKRGMNLLVQRALTGFAAGVMVAGWMAGNDTITATATMALSIGIAIQNFPEGAIISMPLQAEGVGKGRAFLYGVLSGIVEPLAAILTMMAAGLILPALPYLLGFAAGAMIYVVVEQLIPEASAGEHSNLGTLFFAAGFTIMLALDVALG